MNMTALKITDTPAGSVGRLGGPAPILEEALPERLKHFFSLDYEGDILSVFFTDDFDDDFDNRGCLVPGDTDFLRIVIHQSKKHRDDQVNASSLPFAWLVGRSESDSFSPELNWTHHKVGGYSTLEVLGAVPVDHDKTFVAQIAFPDADDLDVDADWPVCDCLFAVYTNEDKEYFAAWNTI